MKFVRALLRRLARIGIVLEPFLVVREGENRVGTAFASDRFSFVRLVKSDAAEIVQLDPSKSEKEIRERFDEGKLCFGMRDGSRLIAKMWCDLEHFNYSPEWRRLAADEAYLYAASALPEYRGQSIAPTMRQAGYEMLRSMRRTRYCSYTDYFNMPARRFKDKLGARNEALRLHVTLFNRWSKTYTLRRYLSPS